MSKTDGEDDEPSEQPPQEVKKGRGRGRGQGRGRGGREKVIAGASSDMPDQGPKSHHKMVCLKHCLTELVQANCLATAQAGLIADLMPELEPAFQCGLTRPNQTEKGQKPFDCIILYSYICLLIRSDPLIGTRYVPLGSC